MAWKKKKKKKSLRNFMRASNRHTHTRKILLSRIFLYSHWLMFMHEWWWSDDDAWDGPTDAHEGLKKKRVAFVGWKDFYWLAVADYLLLYFLLVWLRIIGCLLLDVVEAYFLLDDDQKARSSRDIPSHGIVFVSSVTPVQPVAIIDLLLLLAGGCSLSLFFIRPI